MSILNWQVNSSSNFISFFIVMTQNSLVNFKLIHFLLWIKWSHQSRNYMTFERAMAKIYLIPHVIFESTSQFSFKFVSIFSAIKHNSFILFLAQTLHTLFKRSPLQCKFLRFLSSLVKIRHIPHVNFELASQFLFNCESMSWHITPL